MPRIQRITALLASAAALGGLAELAMLRHWNGLQLIPWFILAAIVVVGVLTAGGGPRWLAQTAGVVGIIGALVGVFQHVAGNHAIGAHLLAGWDSMSAAAQWWAAFSGAVGANPALAPGLLALAGTLLIVSVLSPDGREN